jgi:dihydrofolate synthase/folylpolyglutamate synthase
MTFAAMDKSTSGVLGTPTTALDVEYKKVLLSLFTAVRKPSRHVPAEAMELFLCRKAYFQGIIERYTPAEGPHRRPKFIHVAGSKGKGTTVELMAASLRAAGHSVGVFTSPHLHTACERVKVGNELISREDLVRLGRWALRERDITCQWAVFFDLLLAVALRYFLEQRVDYVLLEAGIGGRFDSTNFVDEPVVTVITSISLDHQTILGDTIEEIALQKAGIVKKGCTLVTSSTLKPQALAVIRKVCDEQSSRCIVTDTDACIVQELGLDARADVLVENACVARAALSVLGQGADGMSEFFWPCRSELFSVEDATGDALVRVVLDGSHNGESVEQFLLDTKRRNPNAEVCVVFGGGKEKCLTDMLDVVTLHADRLLMVQSSHFRSESEEHLVAAVPCYLRHKLICQPPTAKQAGGTVATRLAEAIAHAAEYRRAGRETVVAICGSLFVAAEAREAIFALVPDAFSCHDWVHHKDKWS